MDINILRLETSELTTMRTQLAEQLGEDTHKVRDLDWLIASRKLYESNGIDCVLHRGGRD